MEAKLVLTPPTEGGGIQEAKGSLANLILRGGVRTKPPQVVEIN